VGEKEKVAEETGTRRERIQLEPSGTSGLCRGITRHPCNKLHALFNNQALLKAITSEKMVGEALPKAITLEKMGRRRRESGVSRSTRRRHFTGSNQELRKRKTAGAATSVVKVKAHRGEPANESADIQADMAISSKDVPIGWHTRTNRAVFTWQEPRRKGGTVSYED